MSQVLQEPVFRNFDFEPFGPKLWSFNFRFILWSCFPGTWSIWLRHQDWTLSLIEHQVHMLNMMNFGGISVCGGVVSGVVVE